MAQVDAGQYKFAVAVVQQPPDLVEDLGDRPAGQLRPDLRDDAVAAPQPAAVLDLDEGAVAAAEAGDPRGPIEHARSGPGIRQRRVCR